MAKGKGEVGRLYVAVNANTTKAVNELKKLDQAAKAAARQVRETGKAGQQGSKGTDQNTKSNKKNQQQQDKTKKSTKAAGDEFKKTGEKAKAAGKPLANLQASMYRLSQSFINLRYGNPLGVVAGLTQSFTSLGRSLGGISGKIAKVSAGIAGLVVAVAAIGTGIAYAGAKIATFGLKAASNLEMLRIQYEGLLQSAARGAAEVDYVLQLGTTSVVPTEGLLEANRLLLAYGVTQDKVRQDLLSFFSDFGSATGLSAARLQDMAYALGQVQAQGKANMIDLRQLANAGLNLAQVYAQIAEQQGISADAAKKLTAEGKLTAEILIPAVLALQDNYADAAEKARQSSAGIIANLKDIANIKLGTAFEDLLARLKPLLLWAEEFLEAFDFTKLAAAFSSVFSSLQIAIGAVDSDTAKLARTFSDILAGAVIVVGTTIGQMIITIRFLVAAIDTVYSSGEYAIRLLGEGIAEVVRLVVELVDAITFGLIPGFDDLIKKATDWKNRLSQDSDDVAERARDAGDEMVRVISDATNLMANSFSSWKTRAIGSIDAVAGHLANSFAKEKYGDVTVPGVGGDSFNRPGTAGYLRPTPPKTPGNDPTGGASKVKKDAIDATKYVTALGNALKGVTDMAAKPLGGPSVIEQLFFVDGQGSTSGILSSFDSITKGINGFFEPLIELAKGKKAKKALRQSRDGIIAEFEGLYQELYDLAEKNAQLQEQYDKRTKEEIKAAKDKITELSAAYDADVAAKESYYKGLIASAESTLDRAAKAYEDANGKLQDMLAERDAFLQGVRDSAYAFVNSLSETNETLSRVTELDGVGSFSSVQEQGTASFKAQLEDRLAAVKKFRSDIENLLSRGLDEGLLRQLVEAGPESGGGLAAALAADSDAAIGEINALQSDLAATVGGLQSSLSAAWYDEDISRQSAETARLLAQRDQAQANLDAIKVQRQNDLDDLKRVYDEKVKEQEDLIADLEEGNRQWQKDIQEDIAENEAAANEIITNIQEIVGKLGGKGEGSLYKLGKEAINGLIKGMDKRAGAAVAKAQSIAKQISDTIANAFQIQSPSKVMMGYGENISEGLAIGMENGISKVDMAAARVANAAMISGEISSGAPTVKVFIGDQELKDIVDVQITDASGRDFDVAFAGRRDF